MLESLIDMQARRSVFQIGEAPIRAEAESLKNLGVRSPRKNVSSRGLSFLGNTLLQMPKGHFMFGGPKGKIGNL